MIEAVSERPVGELREIYEAVSQQHAALREAPSVDDIARFEAAMQPVENTGSVVDTVQHIDLQAQDPWVVPAVSVENTGPSIGDRILNGMEGLREGWTDTVHAMESLQSRNDLQPTDILNLQFQMSHTSLMLTMMSQEVGSITQKIDGLLKTG